MLFHIKPSFGQRNARLIANESQAPHERYQALPATKFYASLTIQSVWAQPGGRQRKTMVDRTPTTRSGGHRNSSTTKSRSNKAIRSHSGRQIHNRIQLGNLHENETIIHNAWCLQLMFLRFSIYKKDHHNQRLEPANGVICGSHTNCVR